MPASTVSSARVSGLPDKQHRCEQKVWKEGLAMQN